MSNVDTDFRTLLDHRFSTLEELLKSVRDQVQNNQSALERRIEREVEIAQTERDRLRSRVEKLEEFKTKATLLGSAAVVFVPILLKYILDYVFGAKI